MIDEIMNGMGDYKYSIYQDEEGNVYKLKTDLEQKLVKEIFRLHSQRIKAITYIQEDLCCDYGDYCNNSAKDLLQILGGLNE